ncbi:hypothetical protein E4P41_20915 [Geodermatophilus sp. DF01-2]|uniref:SCO6880 family protein n=1 Tax=Geodermatophilus sp. DF01-2 TaxID=2559610 RepID=UPI001073BD61|nr:SCO6880 family protein [Geodermatophilus sp. DF01_2]TFV53657.1 hypothetical protein E4P41_20915 [Geodermatophilus sp. DF01_2]
MTAAHPPASPRTYGNWRRPASAGLGGLGALGTGLLLAGLIGVIATLTLAGLLWALSVAAVLGLLLASLVVRDRHHRSGVQRLSARIGWARARRGGAHLYRSGPLGRTPEGTCRLPGLAAASRMSEWQDSHGRPFALVIVPAARHATVVLVTEPDGASLVDEEQVDTWVAHWGAWLAALGSEPSLVAAAVTVETAPDSGARLRAEVGTHLDPRAPEVALAMLREVVDTYPAGSATVTAYVSLTFSAAARGGGRRRDDEDVARDIATRLPGLTAGLSATGAGVVRPATAQELCRAVRVAYDPSAAPLFDEAAAVGAPPELRWDDVGPAAAEAGWGWYRHDGALSVTWSMTAAPRGEVFSSVLADLVAPHPDVDRKRVTLLYRPLDAGRSARVVEQDKRTADFRASSTSRPTARVLLEQRAAALTAEEEARGAGLVDFAMLVTATVADADRLEDPHAALDVARAAVDSLAATARTQLRPVYGSQDSAFAAALPLGIVPSAHLTVPREFREAL